MKPTLLAFVVVFLVGCTGGGSWRVRFRSAADRDATRVLEANVREGGCDGTVRFTTLVDRDDPGMQPPVLPEGAYGVEAIARDESCRVIARACVLITLPTSRDVIVDLESVRDAAPDCPAAECVEGTCSAPLDGGTTDGSLPDARVGDGGPSDAGTLDASPLDSATEDGSTTDAAGMDAAILVDAFVESDAYVGPDAFVPAPPQVLSPWSGVATGTSRTVEATLSDPPRRPLVRWAPSVGALSYALEIVACAEHDLALCGFGASLDARVIVDETVLEARPATELGVETTPPLGRRYAFRVGACAMPGGSACAYSAPRYLDVGRIREDLDGDGDGEMVVSRGADVVAFGGASGTPDSTTVLATLTTATNLAYAGDYDANGRGDVVLNAGGVNGRWELHDGAGALLLAEDGLAPTDGLARALAGVGDVDGDGYADFAVAVPGLDEVRIQLGGATSDLARRVVVPGDATLDTFAIDLSTAGDRDFDGLPDLAIASRISVGTVRVEVFSLAGRVPRRIQTLDRASGETDPMTGPAPVSLAGGHDLDGDGRAEIAIGLGLMNEVVIWVGDDTTAVLSAGGSVGRSVAMGDLGGTALARIVAGAPTFGPEGAYGHISYFGSPFITYIRFSPRDVFGAQVGAVDLSGDGRDEMFTVSGASISCHIGSFAGGMIGGGATFRLFFGNPVRNLAR